MTTKIEELDAKINAVYMRAYNDNPTADIFRLDPESGILGGLWAEFDKEVGNG